MGLNGMQVSVLVLAQVLDFTRLIKFSLEFDLVFEFSIWQWLLPLNNGIHTN
jgi:hypothetical protein